MIHAEAHESTEDRYSLVLKRSPAHIWRQQDQQGLESAQMTQDFWKVTSRGDPSPWQLPLRGLQEPRLPPLGSNRPAEKAPQAELAAPGPGGHPGNVLAGSRGSILHCAGLARPAGLCQIQCSVVGAAASLRQRHTCTLTTGRLQT